MSDDAVKTLAIALLRSVLGHYDYSLLGGYNGKEKREQRKKQMEKIHELFLESDLFTLCCEVLNVSDKTVKNKFYAQVEKKENPSPKFIPICQNFKKDRQMAG